MFKVKPRPKSFMQLEKPDHRVKAPKSVPDPQPDGRNKDFSTDESLTDTLSDIYDEVLKGFEDQRDRIDTNIDYWDMYHCRLGPNQFYSGTSQVFVPLTSDAVNARKTRFTNQIFPQSGRYVEMTTSDGSIAHSMLSLVEHYIRKAKLRTDIMPALVKNGDIEGQYSIYVDWQEIEKEVAQRVKKHPLLEQPANDDGEAEDEGDLFDPTEEVDDVEEEVIKTGRPWVEVISDADICVVPATSNSIEEALDNGGSVTVIRRWSKAKIQRMIKKKEINKEAGEAFLKELDDAKGNTSDKDMSKQSLEAAGIKRDARGAHGHIYETWAKLTIDGKRRIHRIYFGGQKSCLSCKRNPFWSDNIPIISCPVEKEANTFKGISKIQAVAGFQILANDAVNQGMDSASYALMPIVMTDPVKNPRIGSMILSLAAIWETNPNDTKFVEFPPLWKDAFEIVLNARNQVFQTLGVNPAMITAASASKKPSQAEIAQEQQVDILTTADAVTVIEEGILTPLVQRMLELDHQYRNEAMLVKQYGELGLTAKMEKVDTIQLGEKIFLRWYGVDAARNAQQVQQQIAALNILRGIPPAMYPGYELDMSPAIVQLVENAFGPRIAPLVFRDIKSQLEQNPNIENLMLMHGMDVHAHRFDNHQEHIMAHLQALQATGDPNGTIRAHITKHHLIMGGGAQMQPGVPGEPGGAGPGLPGQPGTPRMGAQPALATGGQNPAGAIAPDQMIDPQRMPR